MPRIGLKSLKRSPLERHGADASLWGTAAEIHSRTRVRVTKAPPPAPVLDFVPTLRRDLERLRDLMHRLDADLRQRLRRARGNGDHDGLRRAVEEIEQEKAAAWDRLLPRWITPQAYGEALGCTIPAPRFSLAFGPRVYDVETTDKTPTDGRFRAMQLHALYTKARGARRADLEVWMLYRCADLIGRKRETYAALARRFSRTARQIREAVCRVDAKVRGQRPA